MRTRLHTITIIVGLTMALSLLGTGCSDDPALVQPPTPEWSLIKSDLPRDLSPEVPDADMEQLAAGNHQFCLNLFKELQTDENLLISPLSIRMAFAMNYAGAVGPTAVEMDQALCYSLDQEHLHPAWNRLDQILAGRNHPGDQDTPSTNLLLTNALWGRINYPFVDEYLDLLAINYGAGIHTADFVGAPESSRLFINDWVADQTQQKVLDLLPPQSISSDVAVVLVNSLYFQASWLQRFDPDQTVPGIFNHLDGHTTSVPMMNETNAYGYYEESGCQAVKLNFHQEDWSLAAVFMLPAEGQFQSFADNLDVETLDRFLGGMSAAQGQVSLPRFSFETKCRLKDALESLGMVVPFTPEADFGGMTQNDILWIDEAYHQTFIAVDENGVEAAAATAIVDVDGIDPDPFTFIANRPFLLAITDQETDTILFFGQVVAP